MRSLLCAPKWPSGFDPGGGSESSRLLISIARWLPRGFYWCENRLKSWGNQCIFNTSFMHQQFQHIQHGGKRDTRSDQRLDIDMLPLDQFKRLCKIGRSMVKYSLEREFTIVQRACFQAHLCARCTPSEKVDKPSRAN